MTKSSLAKIILLCVVLSLLMNVFFGRFLAAKISTLPALNRLKLISPQAPIVINTRQEVRISDTGDAIQTIDSTKSKLSLVMEQNGNQLSQVGAAVNLTGDGLFLTTKTVLGSIKPENLLVKLEDGTTGAVKNIALDPASNLAIIKTDLKNVQVANIGDSKSLVTGQKIIFIINSVLDRSVQFQNSFVTTRQNESGFLQQLSDFPARAFAAQAVGQLSNGEAVANMDGQVVGIWDGSKIISSDVAKAFVSKYLGNKGIVQRPAFGFKYKTLFPIEAKTLNLAQGAYVYEAAAGSASQKAGLLAGDVIVSVDNSKIDESNQLEEILQNYKPGDKAVFNVVRDNKNISLTIAPGVLATK